MFFFVSFPQYSYIRNNFGCKEKLKRFMVKHKSKSLLQLCVLLITLCIAFNVMSLAVLLWIIRFSIIVTNSNNNNNNLKHQTVSSNSTSDLNSTLFWIAFNAEMTASSKYIRVVRFARYKPTVAAVTTVVINVVVETFIDVIVTNICARILKL